MKSSKLYCCMCREQFNKYTRSQTCKFRLLVNDLSWRFLCEDCTQEIIMFMSNYYDEKRKYD